MWKITRDYLAERYDDEPCKPQSCDWNEEKSKDIELYKFRLLDDDGEIYCAGVCDTCDDEEAFAPLDDYGMGSLGCTTIQYKDTVTGKYETL